MTLNKTVEFEVDNSIILDYIKELNTEEKTELILHILREIDRVTVTDNYQNYIMPLNSLTFELAKHKEAKHLLAVTEQFASYLRTAIKYEKEYVTYE